jgi:hypothetical protein
MRDLLTEEKQSRVASSCYISTIRELPEGEEDQQMAKGKTIADQSGGVYSRPDHTSRKIGLSPYLAFY